MIVNNLYCVKWAIGYFGFGVNEYSYEYFTDFAEAESFANDLRHGHYTEVRIYRVRGE